MPANQEDILQFLKDSQIFVYCFIYRLLRVVSFLFYTAMLILYIFIIIFLYYTRKYCILKFKSSNSKSGKREKLFCPVLIPIICLVQIFRGLNNIGNKGTCVREVRNNFKIISPLPLFFSPRVCSPFILLSFSLPLVHYFLDAVREIHVSWTARQSALSRFNYFRSGEIR